MQTIEGEEVFRYISVIFAIPKVQAPTHIFLRVVKHIFIEIYTSTTYYNKKNFQQKYQLVYLKITWQYQSDAI